MLEKAGLRGEGRAASDEERSGSTHRRTACPAMAQITRGSLLAASKILGIPKTPSTRPKRHLRNSRVVLEHVEVLVEVDPFETAVTGPDQWLWFAFANKRVRLLVGQAFGHGRHYFT